MPSMDLVVLIVVGLRLRDLEHAPGLRALGTRGSVTPLQTVFPAVTCSVQASFLTGLPPSQHGAVGNGWYFRDQAQVWLWRQANQLVQGEKVYETAKHRDAGFTAAKLFWWWNMYARVDWSLTPRPEYWANGLKRPGLYSQPAELQREVQHRLGPFPLFRFWGPTADILSTRWIVDSALDVMTRKSPRLTLVYLPHLDYDHQRFGPDDPRSVLAVRAVDAEAMRLCDAALARGSRVLVLSEYGIEAATHPVFVNRILHEAGLLAVQETGHGDLLDAGASRAFAVADHQCAHVYVRESTDLVRVAKLFGSVPGVARVLDRAAQRDLGVDHERSGELVLVAERGAWFAYHYWLDESRRPDFATTVDIHRKPGYDPTELFVDPKLRFPKLRVARRLAQKLLGFRYLMDVIGTDPSIVRGTHGRLFADPLDGPVVVSSEPALRANAISALAIKDTMLDMLELG